MFLEKVLREKLAFVMTGIRREGRTKILIAKTENHMNISDLTSFRDKIN